MRQPMIIVQDQVGRYYRLFLRNESWPWRLDYQGFPLEPENFRDD